MNQPSAFRHCRRLLHDPVGPLHGSGNHLGSRTSLRPAEQIVCPVEIAGHADPIAVEAIPALFGNESKAAD